LKFFGLELGSPLLRWTLLTLPIQLQRHWPPAVQQSTNISWPPGPQQQTRRTPLQWANGTDRRTPYRFIETLLRVLCGQRE